MKFLSTNGVDLTNLVPLEFVLEGSYATQCDFIIQRRK